MMGKRAEFILGAVAFIILAVSLIILNKGVFVVSAYTGDDGFYQQMLPFMSGVGFVDLHVLQYVHFLRYVVIYPFVLGYTNEFGGLYASVILLLFSWPILCDGKHGRFAFVRYLILLMPIFVSFRVFLVACSMAYLYIAIFHHKSTMLMLASLLMASLSSATVLIWLLIFFINFRSIVNDYKVLAYFLSCMIVMALIPSLFHKAEYANAVLGGYSDYIMRSTIFVSFISAQWSRFIFYSILLLVVLFIAVRSLLPSKCRLFYLSYVPFFLGAMLEGAGLISGAIVILLFFNGFRPRLEAHLYTRVLDGKN